MTTTTPFLDVLRRALEGSPTIYQQAENLILEGTAALKELSALKPKLTRVEEELEVAKVSRQQRAAWERAKRVLSAEQDELKQTAELAKLSLEHARDKAELAERLALAALTGRAREDG